MFDSERRVSQVSVIMPVFNGLPYLSEAISSVLRQQGCELELLIIDDGSTDGSLQIEEEFARIDSRIRLLRQAHSGISAALNLGLAECRAGYAAIAEQDDRSAPNRLTKQLEVLNESSGTVLVSSWAHYIGDLGRRKGLATAGPSTNSDFWAIKVKGPIHIVSPTAMFRVRPALEIEGFDSAFDGCQDEHLWNRLAEVGGILTIPEPLVDYRLHTKSASFGSSMKQAAFPGYWISRSTTGSEETIDQYITAMRRERPITYFRLYSAAIGYTKLRTAGALMADAHGLRALPNLVIGALLNPRIAKGQVVRRLAGGKA